MTRPPKAGYGRSSFDADGADDGAAAGSTVGDAGTGYGADGADDGAGSDSIADGADYGAAAAAAAYGRVIGCYHSIGPNDKFHNQGCHNPLREIL